MIGIGDRAPDFELQAASGGTVRLSDALADGPVVLYFYPADFTPVCTAQACMMRDRHEQLRASGHRVLAISPQSAESHAKFAEKNDLPFELLADPDREAIGTYGLSTLFGLITRRATFLIGQDGIVKDRAVGDFSVGRHAKLIERTLG